MSRRRGLPLRIERPRREPRWLLPAVMGGAAGLVLGWMLGRRPEATRDDAVAWSERLGEGLDAAVEGLRDIHARFVKEPPPDPLELESRLALVEGSAGVRVHDLGDGIVELTGTASDEASRAAAAAVARVAGVHAVVNRVWTPSSATPAPN